MAINRPPNIDPIGLEVGTIRISYGFAFIVQDDEDRGLYWEEIDPLFDWDNIEFWTIDFDYNSGTVRIIPKPEKLVIDGIEQEVNNPIPITLTFSNREIKTQIQDYGTVYSEQNTWADLFQVNPTDPLRENNAEVRKKLSDDIGEEWKLSERLLLDLKENIFTDSKEGQDIVYNKITDNWIDIVAFVNEVATKYYKNTPPSDDEAPEPKFKIGDFVKYKSGDKIYKVFAIDINETTGRVEYGIKTPFADTMVYRKESDLENIEQPKFKTGDRILYPTTQQAGELSGGAKQLIEKATNEKLGYLVVTNVTYNNESNQFNYLLGFQDLPNASQPFEEDDCVLYEPKPEPKFKTGDQVTYDKMPFATFTVDNVTGFNYKRQTWVYRLNNNDKKSSFSAGYEPELKLIVVVETPKDCEADASKIISGQVKRFYDLNKPRIEKLDTKISCKIIQALVGLSEYESCGSPSSSSLPKAKTDLLSRISNLKI